MRGVDLGGCRLTGLAGSGGFAVTYAGRHPAAGPVAVKVLSPNWADDLDVANRFEVECETLAGAPARIGGHRYAVPRYVAHGRQHGVSHLVTELCQGGSLALRLPLVQALPVADRVGLTAWLLVETAACLAVVHDDLGVIHRDLSPGNLLFRRHPGPTGPAGPDGPAGAAEELVVGDFGLLKDAALQSNISRVIGTAAYAAPEVRNQGVCDQRSDVYSLGVIAWELLTGRPAEPDVPLAPVAVLAPGVPAAVADLVAAMTATEREQRPDLARVAATVAPLATRPPPAPPADRIIRPLPPDLRFGPPRGRLVAGIGAGLVGSLAIVGGVAWWQVSHRVHYQRFAPDSRGIVVELTDEWTSVDTDPGGAFAVKAENPGRNLALLVTPAIASDAQSALERSAAAIAKQADAGAEIVQSTVVDDRTTRLDYRSGGLETVIWYRTQRCGAVGMAVSGPAPLSDADRAHIDDIGRRFTVVQDLAVGRSAPDLPSGFQRLGRNGIGVAVPRTFVTAESANHCLFVIDTSGRSRAAAVELVASARADQLVVNYEKEWTRERTEVVDATPTADGTVRRHIVTPGTLEAVYAFVDSPVGVYVTQVVEYSGQPWSGADLALADQIVASLEVAP